MDRCARMVVVALCLLGVGVLFFPADGVGDDLVVGRSLEANLDLPFDAVGSSEEEEEAPDFVLFYGQPYEASAVVFALDESGSMSEQGRFDLQRREATRAISHLGPDAEYNVLYYSNEVNTFRESLVQANENNKNAGIAFVRSRMPKGLTCIGKGVIKGLQIARKSASKYRAVIVTSDGGLFCDTDRYARSSAAQMQRVLQETVAANPGLQVKVHTVFVGSSAERRAIRFMRILAEAHGGTFRVASP